MDPLVFRKSHWNSTNSQKDIEVTALDICQNYIVLASKCGSLHFYSLGKFTKQNKILAGVEVITEVSISSDPGYLAYAISSGRTFVLKVPHIPTGKQFYPVVSDQHAGSTVTVINWSREGKDLYIGDSEGKVSSLHLPANFATSILMNLSQKLLNLHSPVIQMCIHRNLLLISTNQHSYMCHIDLETYSTIGTTPRHGAFGCCFYVNRVSLERNISWCSESVGSDLTTLKPGKEFWPNKLIRIKQRSEVARDLDLANVRIFCARPETRLWECNSRGEVISTYQINPQEQKIVSSNYAFDEDSFGVPSNWQHDYVNLTFEKVIQFDSIHIAAFTATGIFIIDMETVSIRASMELGKRIVKAKVSESITILLFEDKSVEMYEILYASSSTCNVNGIVHKGDSNRSSVSSADVVTPPEAVRVATKKHFSSDAHSGKSDNISILEKQKLEYASIVEVSTMNLVSSEKSPPNNSPKEKCGYSKTEHHIQQFLELTSKLDAETFQKNCRTNLEGWLNAYIIHSENNYPNKEVVSQIRPSRKVSQTFLICIKNHILTNNTVRILDPKKCHHKRTPLDVRKNDLFYSQLIDSDIGLLDASFLMNNFSTLGSNLYPLIWSSLFEKIFIDQSTNSEVNLSELEMLRDLSLDRSHIVVYMANFLGFPCLNKFIETAVVLSNEHVIEDILYFLLCFEPLIEDPESFREDIVRNYLLDFDKSSYYYELHWSSSPELQYEIIKSLLTTKVSSCPCLVLPKLDPKTLGILKTIFNLPLYDIKETLRLCINFNFFYGIFSIISRLPSYLVLHILPLVFQFGNKDDIANFIRSIHVDMYSDILKFLELNPRITECCALCGHSLSHLLPQDEVSPLKRNYFIRNFAETFLDAVLIQAGARTVLDVLVKSEDTFPSLCRKFYQNCIQAQISLSKGHEASNGELRCPLMSSQMRQTISSLQVPFYSEDKTLIADLVSMLTGYLSECTWPVDQLISKYMQNSKLRENSFVYSNYDERLVTRSNGPRDKNVRNKLCRYYHWGIEVYLMGRCKLCTLDLNIPAMIRAGGLTVFICGCVVHSACTRSSSCPYCCAH